MKWIAHSAAGFEGTPVAFMVWNSERFCSVPPTLRSLPTARPSLYLQGRKWYDPWPDGRAFKDVGETGMTKTIVYSIAAFLVAALIGSPAAAVENETERQVQDRAQIEKLMWQYVRAL